MKIQLAVFAIIAAQVIIILGLKLYNILFLAFLLNWLILIVKIDKKHINDTLLIGIVIAFLLAGIKIADYSLLFHVLSNVSFPTSVGIAQILHFLFGWGLMLVIGYLISKVVAKDADIAMRFLYSFSFGTGLISIIMIFLGIVGQLNLVYVSLSHIFVLLVLFYLNKDNIKFSNDFRLKINRSHAYLLTLVLPFIFFSFYNSLAYPVLYVDSMAYGIELTRIIYSEGKIPFLAGGPSISLYTSANYPPAYQMLGVYFSILAGFNETLLKAVSPIVFIFCILLVYRISREVFQNERQSLVAAVIFCMFPLTILFSRFYIFYIYLLFQFSFALFLFYQFSKSRSKNLFFLSAMVGGFSSLSSYLGLLYMPILFICYIFYNRRVDKPLLVSLLVFIVVISPWYMRNFALLGNPIWPFGGGHYIDKDIQTANKEHFNIMSKLIGFGYDNINDFISSANVFLFSYVDHLNTTFNNGLRPFILLFAAPAVAYAIRNKRKDMTIFIIWFVSGLLAYIFLINQFERYIILFAVPIAVLSAYLISALFANKLSKVVVSSLLAMIYINFVVFSSYWNECHGISENNIREYISDKQKALDICYPNDSKMWQWIDNNIPKDEKIATYEIRWYYMNASFIPLDSWALRDLYQTNSIGNALNILEDNNISYILIAGWTSENSLMMPATYKNNVIYSNLNSDNFNLIKSFGDSRLYKVVY